MSSQKEIKKKIEENYRELNALKAQIAKIGPIKKGTISNQMMRCGKKSCRCYRDPKFRHGPYLRWSATLKGRSIAVRIPPGLAKVYRDFNQNFRKLKKIIREMEKVSDIILEEKIKLTKIKNTDDKK